MAAISWTATCPVREKPKTDLAKMFWEGAKKFPAVARALCAR
jgi:hypothetical protein